MMESRPGGRGTGHIWSLKVAEKGWVRGSRNRGGRRVWRLVWTIPLQWVSTRASGNPVGSLQTGYIQTAVLSQSFIDSDEPEAWMDHASLFLDCNSIFPSNKLDVWKEYGIFMQLWMDWMDNEIICIILFYTCAVFYLGTSYSVISSPLLNMFLASLASHLPCLF